MAQIGAQYVQAVDPVPVGSLQAFAGPNAPTGWLLCDGSVVNQSAYPELFSVIGSVYNNTLEDDGVFRLPDLRGRMPIGAGNQNATGNNTNRILGVKGGDTRMPQHNHGITDPGHVHQYNVHGGAFGDGSGAASLFTGFPVRETRSTGNNSTNISINNAGTGTGDNMPPFLVTNYIIKATSSIPRGGIALGSTPPVVTSLPVNPQVGEEVYLAIQGVLHLFRWSGSGWEPSMTRAQWAGKNGPTSLLSEYRNVWAKGYGSGTFLDWSTYNYGIVVNKTGMYECIGSQRAAGGTSIIFGISQNGSRTTLEDRATGIWTHSHAVDAATFAISMYTGILNAGEIVSGGANATSGVTYASNGWAGSLYVRYLGQ